MKKFRIFHLTGMVVPLLVLAGCTGGENPQLLMCKSVTEKLVGSVGNWKSDSIDKRDRQINVKVVYEDGNDSQGEALCVYRKPASARDDPNAPYPTSPTSVTLNGTEVGTRELMAAGVKASKEVIEGIAAETAKQSKELAADAKVKAEELTEEAARLVEQAEQKAAEMGSRAGEVAEELGQQARDKLQDASKAMQQKLEQ